MSADIFESPEAWAREPFNPHSLGIIATIPPEVWASPKCDDPEATSLVNIEQILGYLTPSKE